MLLLKFDGGSVTIPDEGTFTYGPFDAADIDANYAGQTAAIKAKIIALDARVDPATRNAMVRARIEGTSPIPAPGASVRVRVPVGSMHKVIAIPVSALRKGPGGDQVFVIAQGQDGQTRVRARQVQSGPMAGDEIVIHEGLTAGEQVAAIGSFKLRDGALVIVSDSSPISSGRALD